MGLARTLCVHTLYFVVVCSYCYRAAHYTVRVVDYRICILPLRTFVTYIHASHPRFEDGVICRSRLRLSGENPVHKVHVHGNFGFRKVVIIPENVVSDILRSPLSVTDQNLE